MRKKAKFKTIGIDVEDIKSVFPIFWKKCLICQDKIRLEKMWHTEESVIHPMVLKKMYLGQKHPSHYICTECAVTSAHAALLFTKNIENTKPIKPPPPPPPIPKKL